ncbi:hypothetical protein F5Y04DRAFT_290260 [Hypomontagnella monticulosa]|nr:hypothetical protein F5Y04DRAFT_290260 [Hypomontagnella monticulosa]
MNVNGAESLKRLSLPRVLWNDGSLSSLYISDMPSSFGLDVHNMTDVDDLGIIRSEGSGVSSFSNVQRAWRIKTDECIDLWSLAHVHSISISARSTCFVNLPALESVEDIYLANISGISLGLQTPIDTINGSLTLKNSTLTDPGWQLQQSAIGSDANITSNWRSNLDFSSLISVGHNLFFANNTNCTISFDHLTEVAGSLSMIDNVNTTLPILPRLERVGSIHLRGYIDTSYASNIFPALKFASGSITIEPWNDFNCSKLLSQQRDGIIHSVYCNGTDNDTGNTTTLERPDAAPTPTLNPEGSTGLSQGAWAGIGVSIGVVIIGGICVAAWFIFRFKRLLNDVYGRAKVPVTEHDPTAEIAPQADVQGLHEVTGQGIIREKPDDHLHEMLVQPAEKLSEHVHEMSSSPLERPSNSQTLEELREATPGDSNPIVRSR